MRSTQWFVLGVLMTAPLNLAAFDPASFNVYAIDSIGATASGIQTYSNSDFEGITGSGGNSYFTGMGLNGNNTLPSSLYSLYSGGTVSFQNGQVNNGGIQAAGTVNFSSGTVSGNVNSGGSLTGGNGTITGSAVLGGTNTSSLTINGGFTNNQPFTSSINYNSINSFFSNASQYWNSLTPNIPQYISNGNNGPLTYSISYGTLTVNGPLAAGHNILNLTESQFSGLNSLTVSGPSNSYLIINVSGTTVSSQLLTYNLSGSGFSINNILINLPQATTATIEGGASLLAPLANVTFASGALTGNLIAMNLLGSGQVDQGSFVGYDSDKGLTVPEPSSVMLMGSFLFMTAVGLKRSSKRSQTPSLHL